MKKALTIGAVILSVVCCIFLIQPANFAQIVPQPLNEQSGLSILDAKCGVATATKVSSMSCRIRNESVKEVAAFAVFWTITTVSGKTAALSTIEDMSLVRSLKKIAPGEIIETEPSGEVTGKIEDPITKIGVVVDFVLFSDGSTFSRNNSKLGSQIINRQVTANYLRRQLLKIYNEKGLDALLVELSNQPICQTCQ
jgi:hypothetical protein